MEADPLHNRLRRVEGQIQGIQRMLEDGRQCEDVLTQLLAARSALEQACLIMVEHHVRDCVLAGEMTADDPRMKEIVDALRLLVRSGA